MGLFDQVRNLGRKAGSEFIEIIEWLDESDDSVVHRFPVYNQEIKMGARLTVRENQLALFVNEGRAADLFAPGLHTLSTRNVPILTTLKGWKYGFNSPFKAEVYFFNTRIFTDLKWGTSQPVLMRDKEFGMIRLRAFGTWAMRVADARTLFSTLVGTRGLTTTEEITGQLRSIILTRLSDAVAESGIPALDLASNYDELSVHVKSLVAPEFTAFGFELSRFFVENLSLPEEVQAAIDQRTKLGVIGGMMPQYAQLQAAEAMKIAAGTPGGAAGAGVGLGAGIAMGQQLSQAMAPPPALAAAPQWTITLAGRNFGPYTEQAVREMIATGQVEGVALAWKPGAAGWSAISGYPEFADLFRMR